ncbi:uncharacterized protein LOC134247072 [Saccostrea cucullata]|uniref:uncharacterized protein LOC134247072 n=1 Tax=Saccostrea cuccullata TaxID=36930 RepID=UPI002ED33616
MADKQEESEKRLHVPTEKGLAVFEAKCVDYKKRVDKLWNTVEDIILSIQESDKTIKTLRKFDADIRAAFEPYVCYADEYRDFLVRTNSEASKREDTRFSGTFVKAKQIVENSLEQIKTLRLDLVETASHISGASSGKRKQKLEFLKKEAELQKEKLKLEEEEITRKAEVHRKKQELDINLKLLKEENVVMDEESEGSLSLDIESESKDEQVRRYVESLNFRENDVASSNLHTPVPDKTIPIPTPYRPIQSYTNRILPSASAPVFHPAEPTSAIPHTQFDSVPIAQQFPNNPASENALSDLTLFMMRKQLVPERLSTFDDKAESYNSWKCSFLNIMSEIKVSKHEELDLLINRLSGKSKEVASSIRNANPGEVNRAVKLIWERLDEMFGRPEMIESSLRLQLENFRQIAPSENSRLYDLLNILIKVESLKANPQFSTSLAYFDSSAGVNPILLKLPYHLQEKWISRASIYKRDNTVHFPPFSFFVQFIKEMCAIRNDPAFMFNRSVTPSNKVTKTPAPRAPGVHARRTDVNENARSNYNRCPYHKADHSIHECNGFRAKPLIERKNFLQSRHICTRCCTFKHLPKDCTVNIQCRTCGSHSHATALHPERSYVQRGSVHGGESNRQQSEASSQSTQSARPVAATTDSISTTPFTTDKVSTSCTQFCGEGYKGRSCSKTLLVDVFHSDFPNSTVRLYAILDDQSNRSLASPDLFDVMNITSEPTKYTLTSCSGNTVRYGRRAHGLMVRSVDGSVIYELPSLIECDDLPNELSEVPTPDVAKSFDHLRDISSLIPEFDPNSKIQLLIGRDLPEAHHIKQQIVGPKGTPYALELGLGWVIIGEVCLGKIHPRDSVCVNKVSILGNGSATCNEPCQSYLHIKDHISTSTSALSDRDFRGDNVFTKTLRDDEVGLSVEDRVFLKLMDTSFEKDEEGFWTAPLPFRQLPDYLPNNKPQAYRRAQILHCSLQKDPVKKEQFVTFMRKVLDSGAAEEAPSSSESDSPCWYLPLFGVQNPKKPGQVRGVFDSSAVFEGTSLNGMLMSGPDMVNSLLGILLRFRKNEVAMTADIEQMFYRFRVNEKHRDFLRFYWYRNNDPDDILIEYRMTAHVFGNSPSPAIATYGLRKTVENADLDVKDFVNRNFYVDDGLISLPSETDAISLMKRTQSTMQSEGKLRLHKITSNKRTVMDAFDPSDHGENLKEIDSDDTVHRSLGLCWSLNDDTFRFTIPAEEKPFTRRGLLSHVNSLFDPLGFIAPITLSGKILLREVTSTGTDWDTPLQSEHLQKWTEWISSLQILKDVTIPRMLSHVSISIAKTVEVHIFCDASEKAIAASAYLKVTDNDGHSSVRFLMGKGKLAPSRGHTIPRLELCAAVLATEIAQIISIQLDIPLECMCYNSDSRVVLGYVSNRTRRFYSYVSNRVDRILKISSADQWNYISTDRNPADSCTRSISYNTDIMQLPWIVGPQWLCEAKRIDDDSESFSLIEPDNDVEVRPLMTKSSTGPYLPSQLGTERFERFSSWKSLIRAVMTLQKLARKLQTSQNSQQDTESTSHIDDVQKAECLVLRELQKEHFQRDIEFIMDEKPLPRDSKITQLSPFLDKSGLLRVGGRINAAANQVPAKEVNPIILPKGSHITCLIIRDFHEKTKHQGRLFTEGAVRTGGYWAIGAKRVISSLIHKCVTCRKLRRYRETQKMADVPAERLIPGPPFTSIGIDAFGPWEIVTRKTRGGAANSKRWAILFTCLVSRAVHIEVIEEMSSSSFINALRRFLAIRGPVKLIRSDRGTNFIGAAEEMKVNTIRVEKGPVQEFLETSGITWKFNVPHASHMGGIWERIIGITRRILDSMLLESRFKPLTHEVLVTFMCEVCAIINSRPITPISTDPEEPLVINPSMILTGKVDFLPVISHSLDIKDVHRAQWKHAQVLADIFWQYWKREYLKTLQSRRIWKDRQPNVKPGDVVIVKDSAVHRNYWPMGIVEKTFASDDGLVRKVQIRVIRDGKPAFFMRPVHELVVLLD